MKFLPQKNNGFFSITPMLPYYFHIQFLLSAQIQYYQKLRSALSQARNRNNRIAKENLQLRKDYDELKVKYAKVLGMNQKLQEKRLIKL